MSRYRVAHYGTGHTGALVLRQLLQRPDIELVVTPQGVHTNKQGDRT